MQRTVEKVEELESYRAPPVFGVCPHNTFCKIDIPTAHSFFDRIPLDSTLMVELDISGELVVNKRCNMKHIISCITKDDVEKLLNTALKRVQKLIVIFDFKTSVSTSVSSMLNTNTNRKSVFEKDMMHPCIEVYKQMIRKLQEKNTNPDVRIRVKPDDVVEISKQHEYEKIQTFTMKRVEELVRSQDTTKYDSGVKIYDISTVEQMKTCYRHFKKSLMPDAHIFFAFDIKGKRPADIALMHIIQGSETDEEFQYRMRRLVDDDRGVGWVGNI